MKNYNINIEKIIKYGIIFFSWIIFSVLKAVPYINEDIFICMSIILLTYFIGKDFYDAFVFLWQKRHKKFNFISLSLCSMFISFSIGANDWFYDKRWGYWNPTLWGGVCWLSMVLYVAGLCITVNYWISTMKMRSNNVETGIKFKYIIYMIFFSSGILYLIAYNPAHMHADTYVQLRQVFEIDPLHDWHPVFHTLLMKLFFNICYSPALFVIFHIAFFAYVMTVWLVKLRHKGISSKILYFFACTFYLNIAYGFLITDIWKDNIYNILVIWITYILYCMIDNFRDFDNKLSNYFRLVICAMGIYFMRHNGIVPMVFILLLCLFKGIKEKKGKLIYSGLLIGIMCFVVKPIIYDSIKVIPNEKGIKYIPIVHDIAAVLVCNQGENLSDEVVDEMETVISLKQWTEHFQATDSDSYTFQIDGFLSNLNKKSTRKMLSLYIRAVLDEPCIIIGARLMSSQEFWSVFKRSGQGDYLGEKTNAPEIERDFGYIRAENKFTLLANNMYDVFENSKFLNTLFYRVGVWMDLMIIAIFVGLVNKKLRKFLVILVPIIGYMISLLIAMTCQNLRYVWAIFPIGVLFFLIVLAEYHKAE